MNKDIAQFTLETALKQGASHCRVASVESTETSVSFLNGEMEKIQESTSNSIWLSVFAQGRFGVFATNRTEKEELVPFIKRCIESCLLLSPDQCRTLPESKLYYKGGMPDLQLEDKSFGNIPFEDKLDILRKTDNEAGKEDNRLISTATDYDDCLKSEYLIDSQGLEAEDRRTAFTVSCECTLKDKGDSRPQNSWFEGSTFFGKLPVGCGRKAYERTAAMLGAGSLSSGKYNIVLDNSVSSRAVSSIISALHGSAIQQQNSFLLDSLGKRIFPESMSIADNPHIIGASGSCWYDNEGIASQQRDIIRNGIVETYMLSTYYANKLQMQANSGETFALYFPENSGIGREEILRKTGNGILVTGFNGGNSNPVTGDFSYGIEGFYFENGQIVRPVRELNLTGDFISLWAKNIFIGNDPIDFLQWQIPTLAFSDMDVSGL